MDNNLKDCWEMKKCGREQGGGKTSELGICPAAIHKLGHSCWAVTGTLCGGKVQGSLANKKATCMDCVVYKKYHRVLGENGKDIRKEFPKENDTYREVALKRLTLK